MWYNAHMEKRYTHTRIWTQTIRKLRLVYALTGESMVSILDRLIAAELDRIQTGHLPQENQK
jgi:uncharacterized metal-binding protein